MTTFDKREEGFEKKFVIDEELKFKAEARRNRLLGLWVAAQLGMTGDAASAYAKQVVAADFDGAGHVARKVTSRSRRQGRHPVGARASQQNGRTDGAGDRAGESGDVTGVIPGRAEHELRCAIAHRRISKFPDAPWCI